MPQNGPWLATSWSRRVTLIASTGAGLGDKDRVWKGRRGERVGHTDSEKIRTTGHGYGQERGRRGVGGEVGRGQDRGTGWG